MYSLFFKAYWTKASPFQAGKSGMRLILNMDIFWLLQQKNMRQKETVLKRFARVFEQAYTRF